MSTRKVIDQMDLFRKPLFVPVAPGVFVPTHPEEELPDVVLCKVVDCGDGNYRLEPFREDWIEMTTPKLKLLGLENKRHTLKRLGSAGFIELCKIAPGCYMLNLTSYYGHIRRVAEWKLEDKDFWEAGRGNREAYQEAGDWI